MKKASPPIHAEASPSHGKNTTSPDELLRTAPSKIARVLVYLRHFNALNLFEAEHIGDHCLPSTISSLTIGHGLTFEHITERVPNSWGAPSDCTRYRLPASQHEQADKVLATMFTRRAKAPKADE